MVTSLLKNKEKLVEDYSSTLTLLGKDIVQKYILKLAIRYRELNNIPFIRNNKKVIDEGTNVLLFLMKYKLVSIDSITNNLVYLKPDDSIFLNIEELEKDIYQKYPIYEKSYKYHSKSVLGLERETITHYTGIAKLKSSNINILNKLSNIPFRITSEFSDLKRIPKKGEESIDENYLIETQLMRNAQKKYNNKIVHFPFQYDKRGRIYCKSYLLNTQSEEWSKASIELANKEKVSYLGMIALKKDIANQYGLDKETAVSKLKWFEGNEEHILQVANENILDSNADSPIMFLKACKAYKDAKEGKPIGYMCSIDSTSSGIQLLSVLSRDKESARLTNLTSDSNRFDIYTEVTKRFFNKLNQTYDAARLKRARKVLKPCVMTHYYNSVAAVKNKLNNNEEYYSLFLEIQQELCKGPAEVMSLINKTFLENSDKTYLCWTMPDGFDVVIEQEKDNFYKINTPYFSCVFKYQDIAPDERNNFRKLCPNIIHSIDGYICRELIRKADFEISPIHDSFYSHPNNIHKISELYKEILQEINEGKDTNLLSNILSDISGYKIDNPFLSKEPLENILESYYALC